MKLTLFDYQCLLIVAMNGTDVISKLNEDEVYVSDEQKRQHRLEIIKTLGEGTHGKVVLAKDPDSMQLVNNIHTVYVV